MSQLKTISDLAMESAADNAHDCNQGRHEPRGCAFRIALARRIRYRRSLWDQWASGDESALQSIRGCVGFARSARHAG